MPSGRIVGRGEFVADAEKAWEKPKNPEKRVLEPGRLS